MAKTIEQYAEEYFDKNFSRIGDMHMDDGIKTVFIESAKNQHRKDMEKACEWFKKHIEERTDGYGSIWLETDKYETLDLFLERFCKAMEEEQ